MINAETQTEPDLSQMPTPKDAEMVDVQHDHVYPKKLECKENSNAQIKNVEFCREIGSSTPIKNEGDQKLHDVANELSQSIEEEMLEDIQLDDPHETSFHIGDSSGNSDIDEESFAEEIQCSPERERKFIVFESCLELLLARLTCPVCNSPQNQISKFVMGTLLKIKIECIEGHTIVNWASQPLLGQMPAGNLLCSVATLFSGETYQHMKNFADFMNLAYISRSVYFKIQRELLIPAVNEKYGEHVCQIHEEFNGIDTFLAGGRFDSPGFNAKYCLYTMMGQKTNKIVM